MIFSKKLTAALSWEYLGSFSEKKLGERRNHNWWVGGVFLVECYPQNHPNFLAPSALAMSTGIFETFVSVCIWHVFSFWWIWFFYRDNELFLERRSVPHEDKFSSHTRVTTMVKRLGPMCYSCRQQTAHGVFGGNQVFSRNSVHKNRPNFFARTFGIRCRCLLLGGAHRKRSPSWACTFDAFLASV